MSHSTSDDTLADAGGKPVQIMEITEALNSLLAQVDAPVFGPVELGGRISRGSLDPNDLVGRAAAAFDDSGPHDVRDLLLAHEDLLSKATRSISYVHEWAEGRGGIPGTPALSEAYAALFAAADQFARVATAWPAAPVELPE